MRALFVNDTGARGGNAGCQLTSRTLRTLLQAAGMEAHSLPWSFARRMKPRNGDLWRAFSNGRILEEPVLHELAELEYGPHAVAEAQASDLILFQPEGTISDRHPLLRIVRFLSLPLWAALHGKVPVVVANGTFPLFTDHRAAPIALLMRHADRIMLRDRIAARHWRVDHAPDSAVLWKGVSRGDGNGLLITTAAEGDVATDLDIGRVGLVTAKALGLRPLILTKGWERLLPLKNEVAELGGEIFDTTDLDETDRVIAGCRLHLGGRYHMALLCATKGIPSALVRSNTHKNLWLAEEFEGIEIAQEPAGLFDVALNVDRTYPNTILADVARLSEETTRCFASLPSHRNQIPVEPLSAGALAHLRREVWAERWKALVRSLSGK